VRYGSIRLLSSNIDLFRDTHRSEVNTSWKEKKVYYIQHHTSKAQQKSLSILYDTLAVGVRCS